MTVDSAGGGSFLYLDEITRAAVRPNYSFYKTVRNCHWNECNTGSSNFGANCYTGCGYDVFYVDWSKSELAIGLKQYETDKPVACRAINT